MGDTSESRARDARETNQAALVVDDNEVARAALARALGGAGFEVVALDRSTNLVPVLLSARFALVIVADEVLESAPDPRLVRETQPRCLLVLATTRPTLDSAVWAGRQGVDLYVEKPVAPDRLLAALGTGLTPRAPRYPSVERVRWDYVQYVLDRCGSIRRAADLIAVPRRTLQRWLRRPAPEK